VSPEISERAFEEAIECTLLQYGPDACVGDSTAWRETPAPYGETPPGGYYRRRPEDYDRALCVIPGDVIDFILATQPKEWEKLKQHHGTDVEARFLNRLASEIERRGALDVLRSGIVVSRTRGADSASLTSGHQAGLTRKLVACTQRISSPSCASCATARRTRTASTSFYS
jgi:hypothetical protein